MGSSSFLSLPPGFVLEQVRVLYDCVTICVLSTAQSAACPLCSQPSTRIHSRYLRTLADLPIGGRHARCFAYRAQIFLSEQSVSEADHSSSVR